MDFHFPIARHRRSLTWLADWQRAECEGVPFPEFAGNFVAEDAGSSSRPRELKRRHKPGWVPAKTPSPLPFPYVRIASSQSIFDPKQAHEPGQIRFQEMHMLDILFPAVGLGSFFCLALYARSLGRL
jgi:hypothetical protein